MAGHDTRRICRNESDVENREEHPRGEEIRDIVDESVKQWQSEYDRVSRDDERW